MEALKRSIDGTLRTATQNFGGWQVHEGGRVVSEAGETRDPAAKFSRKIPGPKSIENITLKRDYDPLRDGPLYDQLEALCGTDTVFIVGKIERDGAGNPIRVKSRVGILLEVMDGEGDTNGGTDKATIEVVLGING